MQPHMDFALAADRVSLKKIIREASGVPLKDMPNSGIFQFDATNGDVDISGVADFRFGTIRFSYGKRKPRLVEIAPASKPGMLDVIVDDEIVTGVTSMNMRSTLGRFGLPDTLFGALLDAFKSMQVPYTN
jgi:hypothetical protein